MSTLPLSWGDKGGYSGNIIVGYRVIEIVEYTTKDIGKYSTLVLYFTSLE